VVMKFQSRIELSSLMYNKLTSLMSLYSGTWGVVLCMVFSFDILFCDMFAVSF